MKLGKILVPLVSILSIAILIVSYLSWDKKLETIKSEALTNNTGDYTTAGNTPNDESTTSGKTAFEINSDELAELAQNSDTSVQELVQKRFNAGVKVQMLIVGSDSIDFGEPSSATQLSEAIETAYKGFIEPTVLPFDSTSEVFMEDKVNEIDWDSSYDLILFEPFTLNNNKRISTGYAHVHIQEFIDQVKLHVEDAVVVLQPSYPIYNTTTYRPDTEALQQFAQDNNLPYLNHWEQWPGTDDSELKEYLTNNQYPNEQGIDVWADALTEYFTNQ